MNIFSETSLVLLVSTSIKIGLLGIVLLVIFQFVRNSNLKHRIGVAFVIGMLLMPVASVLLPAISLPVIPDSIPIARPSDSEVPLVVFQDENVNEADSIGSGDPMPESDVNSLFSAIPSPLTHGSSTTSDRVVPNLWTIGLVFYFGGVLYFGIRLCMGLYRCNRLVQNATPVSVESKCELGKVRLFESSEVLSPVMIGQVHPAILLPVGHRRWTRKQLDAILMHELAHVGRNDWIVTVLAEINRAVYWFHMASWILAKHLPRLAEQSCDDQVIASVGNRVDYAKYLVEFAGQISKHSAGGRSNRVCQDQLVLSAVNVSNVEARVDSILNKDRKLAGPIGVAKTSGLICASGIVGVLVAASVLTRAVFDDSNDMPRPSEIAVSMQDSEQDEKDSKQDSETQNDVSEEYLQIEQPLHELITEHLGDITLGDSGEIVGLSFTTRHQQLNAGKPELAKLFSSLAKLQYLESIVLTGTFVSDVIVDEITKLKTVRNLTLWDFTEVSPSGDVLNSKFTNEGIRKISTMDSLDYLYITCVNLVMTQSPAGSVYIDGEALNHIAKMDKLKSLVFTGIDLEDDDLKPLADMIQLTTLHLGGGPNRITDEGIAHLSGLSNLESLGIQQVELTDASLEHLKQMWKLQNLVWSQRPDDEPFSAKNVIECFSGLPALTKLYFGLTDLTPNQIRTLLSSGRFEQFSIYTDQDDEESDKEIRKTIIDFEDRLERLSINNHHAKKKSVVPPTKVEGSEK